MTRTEKRFVYDIRSIHFDVEYVGVTWNVAQRLETHNSGGSLFTAPMRPWRLAACIELPTEAAALEFERYLKSGSGRAFANRHFR